MPRNDPRQALSIPARMVDGARDIWRGTVTRRLVAAGDVPDSLAYRPSALEVGSPEIADVMLRGTFTFDGATAKIERGDPWRVDPPNAQWTIELHGFEWLKHFRAGDGPGSRTAARRFVDSWLHRHGKGAGFPWRPAIVGQRVTAWCMSAALLMENAEPMYRSAFLKSLGIQGRYLLRTAATERDPMDRMRAGMGLVYAGLCLPNQPKMRTEGLSVFTKAAADLTLSDGGPTSRNPSDLLARLDMMIQVGADLDAAGHAEEAAQLVSPIRTAAPILRMMRHGDGGLGLFHGGRTEGAGRVNRVLVESGETSPPPGHSPVSGYMRLGAGRMNVLFDAGSVPDDSRNLRRAHAAPLPIEVSIGRRRMITSCGSGLHLDAAWEIGCRSSVAHSTLTLADHPPGKFAGSARARLRRIVGGHRVIEAEREEDEEGIWALAAHDGYAAKYGLIHYRRLFLSPDGTDLRGEDTLTIAKGGTKTLAKARARRKTPEGPAFAVRFHLHPDVEVEETEKAILMTLASGERWRMMQTGGSMVLEDSIYLPRPQSPRATKQIVIQGSLEDKGGQVRWALKRQETETPTRDFGADEMVGDATDEDI